MDFVIRIIATSIGAIIGSIIGVGLANLAIYLLYEKKSLTDKE